MHWSGRLLIPAWLRLPIFGLAYFVTVTVLGLTTLNVLVLLFMGEILVYDRTLGLTEASVDSMATVTPWRTVAAADTRPYDHFLSRLIWDYPLENIRERDCRMDVEWRLYHVDYKQVCDRTGERGCAVGQIRISRNVAPTIYVPLLLAAVILIWSYVLRCLHKWLPPAPEQANQSQCPSCAYNVTGNTSGVCPECGEQI